MSSLALRGRVPVLQGRDPELRNQAPGTIQLPKHWYEALDAAAEAKNLSRNEAIIQILLYAKRKERDAGPPPPEETISPEPSSARLPKKWWGEFDEMCKEWESRADVIRRLLWAGMLAHGIKPKR